MGGSLVRGEAAVKTGSLSCVARWTGGVHFYQEGVLVAVVENILYALNIAGRFAFLPELLARAAPKTREAGLNRSA